jgi:hypothetical protein
MQNSRNNHVQSVTVFAALALLLIAVALEACFSFKTGSPTRAPQLWQPPGGSAAWISGSFNHRFQLDDAHCLRPAMPPERRSLAGAAGSGKQPWTDKREGMGRKSAAHESFFQLFPDRRRPVGPDLIYYLQRLLI